MPTNGRKRPTGDKTNTDWCILERDPEPRLAVGESAPGLDLLSNRSELRLDAITAMVDKLTKLHLFIIVISLKNSAFSYQIVASRMVIGMTQRRFIASFWLKTPCPIGADE